jgi:hypothetical protein
MAGLPRSDAEVAVAVRVDGRTPYAMFELVELTATSMKLRGPLMLELGEHLELQLTRAGRTVDVEGRISAVARGDDHGEPVTTVQLLDAAAVAPLLSA